jgi:hypothetical protein
MDLNLSNWFRLRSYTGRCHGRQSSVSPSLPQGDCSFLSHTVPSLRLLTAFVTFSKSLNLSVLKQLCLVT